MASEHLDINGQIFLEEAGASREPEYQMVTATNLETKRMGEGKKRHMSFYFLLPSQ